MGDRRNSCRLLHFRSWGLFSRQNYVILMLCPLPPLYQNFFLRSHLIGCIWCLQFNFLNMWTRTLVQSCFHQLHIMHGVGWLIRLMIEIIGYPLCIPYWNSEFYKPPSWLIGFFTHCCFGFRSRNFHTTFFINFGQLVRFHEAMDCG